LNPTTDAVRVKQDIRFAKSLNFKEKKKSANKIQHKSLSTSSLAKLPKIPTSPTTLVLLPPIELYLLISLQTIQLLLKPSTSLFIRKPSPLKKSAHTVYRIQAKKPIIFLKAML